MAAPPPLRLLILGGTSEASRLAARLAGDPAVEAMLSLAGRTANPAVAPIPTRIGGFGGPEGLADYLTTERIAAVIDATHPFAARISRNAAWACTATGVPRALFTRPSWQAATGDRWLAVPDLAAAAEALGRAPRRVFLTTGRLGLATFRAAPQHHYLVRTIDPPAPRELPAGADLVLDRGPFTAEGEAALMRREAIAVLVTKNSGAAASAAKLAAARMLALPVIMVERPPAPDGPRLTSLEAVAAWLHGIRL